jgi:uncharacterized membrane protein
MAGPVADPRIAGVSESDVLTTIVFGYERIDTAVNDFDDLKTAHENDRLPSYDAAVIERLPDGHRVAATTVGPSTKYLLRGAGLGLVVAAIFSPPLAAAVAGAGLGAAVGSLSDDYAALKHAALTQTRRLIDDSAANVIVITDAPHVKELVSIASSRNRTIVPFSPVDIQALKDELQRAPALRYP